MKILKVIATLALCVVIVVCLASFLFIAIQAIEYIYVHRFNMQPLDFALAVSTVTIVGSLANYGLKVLK